MRDWLAKLMVEADLKPCDYMALVSLFEALPERDLTNVLLLIAWRRSLMLVARRGSRMSYESR